MGEPFIDANNNGVRDPQESYTDTNSNGVYDIAEPFTDYNGNGTRDTGIPETFTDTNGDLAYNPAEPFTDYNSNGMQDNALDEPFTDTNGNGVYDLGEPFTDYDGSGVRDTNINEPFTDLNGNLIWDPAEPFVDLNGNGVRDASVDEPFIDTNGNGVWDAAEPFTDINGNGTRDGGELFIDANGNGVYNPPNGVWDGRGCTGTGCQPSKMIWTSITLAFTGNAAYCAAAISPTVGGFNLTNGQSKTLRFMVGDENLNRLVPGSSISITSTGAVTLIPPPAAALAIRDGIGGPTEISFTISDPDPAVITAATLYSITISVTPAENVGGCFIQLLGTTQ
jgi:hypothetical protein